MGEPHSYVSLHAHNTLLTAMIGILIYFSYIYLSTVCDKLRFSQICQIRKECLIMIMKMAMLCCC